MEGNMQIHKNLKINVCLSNNNNKVACLDKVVFNVEALIELQFLLNLHSQKSLDVQRSYDFVFVSGKIKDKEPVLIIKIPSLNLILEFSQLQAALASKKLQKIISTVQI